MKLKQLWLVLVTIFSLGITAPLVSANNAVGQPESAQVQDAQQKQQTVKAKAQQYWTPFYTFSKHYVKGKLVEYDPQGKLLNFLVSGGTALLLVLGVMAILESF